MPLKRPLRMILALLGLLLFLLLIRRVGFRELLQGILAIGWGFIPVILLGGVAHLIKTWAWCFTLGEEHRLLPFRRMFAIRLAGEGVSQLTVAGQVVGETTRALLLKPKVPMIFGVSSVVLDRTMFTFTAMLFSAAGVGFSLVALPMPGELQRYAILALFPISAVLVLAALAIRRHWRFISGPMSLATRWEFLRRMIAPRVVSAERIENTMYTFYRDARKEFWASFLLNLGGHLVAMTEVFLILRLMGLDVPLSSAFVIEALTKLVNLGGALIPGNLGASEGGNILILKGLGYGTADGLALALTRRIRGLVWATIGLAVLYTGSLKDYWRPSLRNGRGDQSR